MVKGKKLKVKGVCFLSLTFNLLLFYLLSLTVIVHDYKLLPCKIMHLFQGDCQINVIYKYTGRYL